LARIANVESLPAPPPPVTATSFKGTPWRDRAGDFADAIGKAASRYEIDPALLTAMAEAESAFDPFAVSHKGACGMLQLLPETAERFGVEDIFDVDQNLDGGAQYMRWLLDRFEGRTDLALAAYNAGENAVDRHGGIPPYRETRNYVSRILGSLR
jgi:soluble lytic murein transglycosylase-like protein